MTVVVSGSIRIDPAKIDELVYAATDFQERCRYEKGCVDYTLSWDVSGNGVLRLYEEWDSAEASSVHGTQPHVELWASRVAAAALEAPHFARHDF
ncbi:putative quinol monooxygenase (plasmid) [Rhodococcus globerulus]|uniref:putative quinol monooxygenase n=1 Tax=Rhodococcus globerulus TaxID=33008 RepID=UPI0039E81B41